MQDIYKPLLKNVNEFCENYFGEKFLGAYLHGSIAQGDAVPYVSDLDYYIVVTDDLIESDKEQVKQQEASLQQKFPFVNGVHLEVHSLSELKKDKFARFTLKYNAVLDCGTDVIREINMTQPEEVLMPDLAMAKGRLSFAKKCFGDALVGKQPACTGEVPEDVLFASRKFARYFVIIEGAYYLMAVNEFTSFGVEDVLKGLLAKCDEYKYAIEITRKVLQDPIMTNIPQDEYLKIIRPLVEWMFEYIEKQNV